MVSTYEALSQLRGKAQTVHEAAGLGPQGAYILKQEADSFGGGVLKTNKARHIVS